MRRSVIKIVRRPIETFLKMEASSGIILAMAAVLALVVANSSLASTYFDFLKMDILGLSLQHWINDGLMVIFFFVIGMELKKEFVAGELSSLKKAALPMAAAVGGMLIPAAVYLIFNLQGGGVTGWGIPMATDIAFAIGILSLFGKRVPLALKVFLLALAIVDDLGAILVIAIFYTHEIRFAGLLGALVIFAFVFGAQKSGVKNYFFYAVLGVIAWGCVLYSGVHATIAGVLLGLATPLTFKISKDYQATYSPLDQLVHWLHPWVSYAIMPVFAFANAGISLSGFSMSEMVRHPVHLGVLLGLVVGKPLGIVLFSRIFVQTKWASLPQGVNWSQMLGLGFLGGVGFTMALFISALALPESIEVYSKTGIVFGSLVAALIGSVILFFALPRDQIKP
ncbi:hypothetical protein AZI86_00390 [Bdellovibrio bacteriovorus]|uniref:Na(+)/H(+) antiporter NhaA n=1 Tax=Bdellovibrio bacteriovorus TaxID=959 RepID=A0A150WMH5_BDEBC|nr:Na+/H+ antiporter NhaA [Bdellovibrio bacteriovorus]KYG65574.1 hypothetical protein AZI86_00390 [Bdellovibrio bacteriovorus]